jgi:uncharacterized OsmC-like protein
MTADELKALQAPLKNRYKDDPAAGMIAMKAEGLLGDEAITCTVATWKGTVEAGLHSAAGGDGLSACSGDMLLESLVACAGVTLRAVATALAIPIKGGTVSAEGEVDFRGTLGISKEVPIGFKSIRLSFRLDSDASAEQLDKLVQLTERYCVILQTLKTPPTISVSRT